MKIMENPYNERPESAIVSPEKNEIKETMDHCTNMTLESIVSSSFSPIFEASFIETNNKTLKYKCPMCNKRFKSKEKVGKHVNSHITVHNIYTNDNFKCSECYLYFDNEDNLQIHTETHKKTRGRPRKGSVSSDEDVKKPFICDKCAKCFKRKQQLLNHSLVHFDIKPFECFHCDKSFKLKQQLQNHMKIHDDVRPFTCEMCDKSFKFKQQLENHGKTHTDIRPFKCFLCEKAFKFKQQLQMHYRVHDDLRLFKCDFCDKAFKLKQQMQFHMKVHSDERPFKCTACEKSFKLKQQLKNHYKTHGKHFLEILEEDFKLKIKKPDSSPAEDSIENLKQFICENCGKSFKFKQQLENHNKTHTNIRPFQCTLCEKAFKFKQHLQIHSIKIHKEKPFQCFPCQKSFKLERQLNTHYKVHEIHSVETKILQPDINLEIKESDNSSFMNGIEDKDNLQQDSKLNDKTDILEPNIDVKIEKI